MYAKAHPFGYKRASLHKEHKGDMQTGVVVIKEDCPYVVKDRDKNGKVIGETTYHNTIVKTHKSFNPKPKRGRTLGDMVYGSMK